MIYDYHKLKYLFPNQFCIAFQKIRDGEVVYETAKNKAIFFGDRIDALKLNRRKNTKKK